MTQAATTTFGCMGLARVSKAGDDLKRVTVEDDTSRTRRVSGSIGHSGRKKPCGPGMKGRKRR